jgi:hypothetical protein
MVTGWLPEHTGAARVNARRSGLESDAAAEGVVSNGDSALAVALRPDLRLAAGSDEGEPDA